MHRLAFVSLVALAGCSQGDDCQDLGGFFFDSADTDAVMPTAVGGKQRYTASTDVCAGRETVTDLLADTSDPSVATVQVVDGLVEVTGVKAGAFGVRATGAQGGGTGSFGIVAIDHVALSSQTGHATFAAGTPFVEIQLLARGPSPFADTPCVDRTVTVSGGLRFGDRWDHLLIGNAAPGDYDETIHAGGSDYPITVTVTP